MCGGGGEAEYRGGEVDECTHKCSPSRLYNRFQNSTGSAMKGAVESVMPSSVMGMLALPYILFTTFIHEALTR